MAYIELSKQEISKLKVMIFAEGTILKPKFFFTIYNHKSYIPIGNCNGIINAWDNQGAEIIYCTSRKGKQANKIGEILRLYKFPGTKLYFREQGQNYKDIVELVKPDILIEDDCKSIGGSWQMCITNINPELRAKIKSIVVKEFKGIDNLPLPLSEIPTYMAKKAYGPLPRHY